MAGGLTITRGSPLAQQVFLVLLSALARGINGFRVTSYDEGEHSPESQHALGTALDLGVRTPTERAAAVALAGRWSALGLTALDEGDHVHLQLFRAGTQVLSVTPSGIVFSSLTTLA